MPLARWYTLKRIVILLNLYALYKKLLCMYVPYFYTPPYDEDAPCTAPVPIFLTQTGDSVDLWGAIVLSPIPTILFHNK